jgi:hypothetical protein
VLLLIRLHILCILHFRNQNMGGSLQKLPSRKQYNESLLPFSMAEGFIDPRRHQKQTQGNFQVTPSKWLITMHFTY